MESEEEFKVQNWVKWTIVGVVLLILVYILWNIVIFPQYNIWRKARLGEAQLKEAEYSRQIKVTEAQANLEAERFNKESEIVRAEGVSISNGIIAGSITEQYIRYLWVKTLDGASKEIIYVPTEANLPITEAGRPKP